MSELPKMEGYPKILDGAALAKKIKEQLAEELSVRWLRGIPQLDVIQVGDNPASSIYVKHKQKDCEECHIKCVVHHLPEDTTQEDLLRLIDDLAHDLFCDAMIVQLPLPRQIDKSVIFSHIPPEKDADCFNPINVGKLYSSVYQPPVLPCTPAGIMELLNHYRIPISGKFAVVLGRSDIVGAPIARLLQDADATVCVCHSKTSEYERYRATRRADIVVSAIGKPGFISYDSIRDYATIIDVGMNRDNNGKLCGDFEKAVYPRVAYYTPVPGGVGPMTRAMLMKNVIKLCTLNTGKYKLS